MSVRDELVISLSKGMMGPRHGRTELLKVDPKHDYVVGILEPEDYVRKKDDDLLKKTNSDVKELSSGDEQNKSHEIKGGHYTEDEFDLGLESTPMLQEIDPRAFPKSMGLAFILDEKENNIDVCATWARYKEIDEGIWERSPDFIVIRNGILDTAKKTVSSKDGINLEISSYKMHDSTKFVSVRIINKTPVAGKTKLHTSDLVFQPQIRVHLGEGAQLKPLPELNVDSGTLGHDDELSVREERNLAMLYRDRSAYGRGFQCGVLWKWIDPESTCDKFKKYENSPYGWIDAATVDQQNRSIFIKPEIRTEYFPVYSISSASDNKQMGSFSAAKLSKNFSPDDPDKDFQIIVKEYSKWIEEKKHSINQSDPYYELAMSNLGECTKARSRIEDGIRILKTNENARLAFCFMNMAMNRQYQWIHPNENLKWKPFQISFILMSLESVVDSSSSHRDEFDLLWYPTGGGKTEAYLGLAIFTMAYRRIIQKNDFDGVSVISRYTLRLLTIQQFRRALKAVMAAETLRTENWHPSGPTADGLWGRSKFSIGLWVGDSVSPNTLIGFTYRNNRNIPARSIGAVDILRDPLNTNSSGDPAQVLNCPRCNAVLAIPPSGLPSNVSIYWIISSNAKPRRWTKNYHRHGATLIGITQLDSAKYYCAEIRFNATENVSQHDIVQAGKDFEIDCSAKIICSNPIFPGYFLKKEPVFGKDSDFEIRCPDSKCDLNSYTWYDYIPTKAGLDKNEVLEPFRKNNSKTQSKGIPINAFTVDDQIYHRCPTMVVATVDKVARLAFEPRGASLFGLVENFEKTYGYFRNGIGNEPNTGDVKMTNVVPIAQFAPPDLIIQDELHLIEGPLGSMVGIYEMAVDILARRFDKSRIFRAKYIGSTATIRAAWSQVASVYERKLAQFPPNALSATDNFFAQFEEKPARDDSSPGRLYLGICTPGTSAQTALKLIWSVLLQTPKDIQNNHTSAELDRFLTTVGYFNAIRELSSAVGLYRQDVPEWIANHFGPVKRELGIPIELSSRIDSKDLPSILDILERGGDEAVPAVFATSMFGTGVDINRLGLMIVNGQPKTTANYIQSTGRVGRSAGGLVIDYFRASKPRDLDHYEFFTRYHRAIQRYVEPITVTPFSLRCLERAAGPVSVLLLRNSKMITSSATNPGWSEESKKGKHSSKKTPPSGSRMMQIRNAFPEVREIIEIFESRSQNQPRSRRPAPSECEDLVSSEMSRWESVAQLCNDDLLYWESALLFPVMHNVVLGDIRHDEKNLSVFENSPQSLRSVEPITRFDG